MFALKCIFLLIGCFVLGSSASKAPFIVPCAPLDSACIVESAKKALPHFIKGLPEFNIPALEPLVMKDVKIDTGSLNINFKSMHLAGTSKIKFVSIVRDPVKLTAKLVLDVPIDVTGQYTMGGNLLGVDVTGKGDFDFKSDVFRFTIDIRLKDVTGDDGKRHFKISGFDYTFDPISKVHLVFNNLYDGDKSKAEPIEKLIDENWKEVTSTLGKPIMEECLKRIMEPIGRFFAAVPAEELEVV